MTILVRHLAEDPSFEGIGYAKASRLAAAFGSELPRLLGEGDPAPFVALVGEVPAESLVRSWMDGLARNDIVVWLGEHGFDPRLAAKVVRLWGAEGARRVREQPYALMALADWSVVDAAAKRLGIAADDPGRLVAAVEAVLYGRLQRQHTWTSDREVRERLGGLLGSDGHAPARAIELALQEGAALPLADGWQAAGAAMMERYVLDRLRSMIDEPPMQDLIARDVSDEELAGWLGDARDAVGVELDDEQREAVRLAVQGRVGLVLGGAGVGKTTVLRAVCAACEAFGRVVHSMALAGRAAVRMREATGRPASTIAAFLKGCESGQVSLGPESLVVVDESSMVDLPTIYRLLRHLPDGCRLLMVGDEAQLGPIGFGLTLHAFVDVAFVSRVRLTRIYRQSAESGIPLVAAAVRAGRLPDLPSRPGHGEGVVLVATARPPTANDVVDVVSALGGFDDDLRIVSAVKAGDAGVLSLNSRFHGIMGVGRARLQGREIAVGEPVMFGRNDYRRDLRNGSLGTVVDVDAGVLSVDFDGVVHEFVGPAIDDVALAYAITVHKSQGSQFRTVVMPIVPSRLLDRSLVYTALTRASERAVLIGERSVLERAVSTPASAAMRDIGFRWM